MFSVGIWEGEETGESGNFSPFTYILGFDMCAYSLFQLVGRYKDGQLCFSMVAGSVPKIFLTMRRNKGVRQLIWIILASVLIDRIIFR